MNRTDTGRDPAAASLDHFLESNQIKLGGQHRSRLQWLVARFGEAVVWDQDQAIPAGTRLIVVTEPPTGPDVELLYRALHSKCVVVIPFAENPAFDFLKSKLKDFGTVGPCGTDGPHELWWGGLSWSAIWNNLAAGKPPLVVSCYPADAEEGTGSRLRQALASHRLDFVVEAVKTKLPGQLLGFEKTRFILDAWERHDRPILWIEPDAVMVQPPSLLAQADCDFAVHKWNRCELSARTLYFGRSEAAEALLRSWHGLSFTYSAVWDGYVLDQAWSLICSQRSLDTIWLPHSYHATPRENGGSPVIIHNVDATMSSLGPDLNFPRALRAARRASRTGAPDSLIVIKSRQTGQGAVTVILHDIRSTGSRMVAESIEAITAAFDKDPGGFDHLELSLCAWQEDVKAVTSAAKLANNRILEIAPSKALPADLFRRLAGDKLARGSLVPLSGPGTAGGAPRGYH